MVKYHHCNFVFGNGHQLNFVREIVLVHVVCILFNPERTQHKTGPSSRIDFQKSSLFWFLWYSRDFATFFRRPRVSYFDRFSLSVFYTMTEDNARALTSSKRKRGVVRASVTKLRTRLGELEKKVDDPSTLDFAQRLASKLDSLDAEFKVHHYSVIEHIVVERELLDEQDAIDQHDDIVTELGIRIQKLVSVCSSTSTSPSNPRNLQSRKLQRLEKELISVSEATAAMDKKVNNTCRLQLHQEQLSEFRRELAEIRDALLTMGLDGSDDLMETHEGLEKRLFDCSLCIKELLYISKDLVSPSAGDGKGVRLPKLDVPTFNGDILTWQTFWEQFCVSVHERSQLSDAEKLVYLRQALRDGTARSAIEGLSRSGEHYKEAVECLRSRFDRPRLIHQAHVRKIIEAPSLRDGSGKDLRRFHDTMQQHLRALKAMGHEPPGPFLTSLLELKLDVDTTFEWRRHSQSSTGIPHYHELLDFVNLRAQASETTNPNPGRNKPPRNPHVNSFATDVNISQCVVCKEKHPLYACPKFKTLPHEQKWFTIRDRYVCVVCATTRNVLCKHKWRVT